MPIAVECPKCEALLSAPDTAAGKKIRCPECQAVVPVPDEDEEAARPKKRKKRPAETDDERPRKRKKPARAAVDDEEDRDDDLDEDEDDDRRPGPGGNPTRPAPVWIAYGICFLSLILGIAGSVYIVKSARERDEAARNGTKQQGDTLPNNAGDADNPAPMDAAPPAMP